MTRSRLGRELKFDVDPKFVLPKLKRVLPKGGRLETTSKRLRSDYYDTADQALLQAQVTLRRRRGTSDPGWQLTAPHDRFRDEIRVDADIDSVPEELNRLLLGLSGGRDLTRIASVVTKRSTTRLLDARGRTLAEIADDTVQASSQAGSTGVVARWREVEIELGDDETELLYGLGKRLRRAGARPAKAASKLARALPGDLEIKPAKIKPRKQKHKLSAGDVVGAYIAEQHRMIAAGDLALRRDDDSVIHRTRVATRRLRSALGVFGSLYDNDRAVWLDGELRWYAALLGEVRDRQVLRNRLDVMIDEIDPALLLGPVRTRVDTDLRNEQREHWRRLQRDLTQDRYLTLLSEIAEWVHDPPERAAAARAANTITTQLKRANQHVSRKLRRANKTGDIDLLHSARKAAKRARYAAEAAEPVIGSSAARKQATRYQQLQDLLGEHQDSLVSADLIRRLAAKAGSIPGENGFAFGILHEREQRKARIARKKAHQVAKRYD
jgi:CHAD domain-containing protein